MKNENRSGYKRTTLGEIAKISSGGTPSRKNETYWGGSIPWVKTAQIKNGYINDYDVEEWITEDGLKNSSTKLVKSGTILMAMYGQGKTRGRVAVLNLEASINQACAAIDLNRKVNQQFMFQQLLSKYAYIRQMSNSGGQENLSSSLIKEIPISLPPLEEQKAIAEVLECWDSGIRSMEKKIELKRNIKRGLMQKLLSGQSRLPGFSGEWETKALGDFSTETREKVGEREITPTSISAKVGFLSQEKKFGRNISGKQYVNYTRLKKGEFSYNKGNSKTYPQGCAFLLKDHDEIAVPNVFISFKLDNNIAIDAFFEQVFSANLHGKKLIGFINSGVRNDGLLNLTSYWFFKIKFEIPSLDEQEAISEILSDTDAEIEKLEEKLARWKDQKKYLLNELVTGSIRVGVA